jgi:hypothetical protein
MPPSESRSIRADLCRQVPERVRSVGLEYRLGSRRGLKSVGHGSQGALYAKAGNRRNLALARRRLTLLLGAGVDLVAT